MQFKVCILLLSIVLAYQFASIEAQLFDRLAGLQNQSVDRPNDGLGRIMNINVPLLYDMIKNGSSIGLNVLSGMVKVERGDEAERNGLLGNGRRPLSVRVFGVPVYERGIRVRPPSVPESFPTEEIAEDDGEILESMAE